MKQSTDYFRIRKKNKNLGILITLFLITNQIVIGLNMTKRSPFEILNIEQNNLEKSSTKNAFQEIRNHVSYLENNVLDQINKYKGEKYSTEEYTISKVSLALSSFGSWPIYVEGELKGGLGAGDIDGDGNEEIVIGTLNGLIRVYEIDGSESSNWIGGKNIGVALTSTPMLANIDGNYSTVEIIIGAANGSVYAFYGNGTSIPGWPVNCEGAVEETLAVGDINGDGKNEVVVGSNSSKVYAYNGIGDLLSGWPKTTGGEVIVAPVLADVDNDGSNDVIVGSTDGKIYVWKGNGNIISNFPKDLLAPITHPLAVADINNDGKIDIVCPAGRTLYLLSHSGTTIHSWLTDSTNSEWLGPIIVDINWDREYEIVSLSTEGEQKSFSFTGEILNEYSSSLGLSITEEPILTDVDNDYNWELLYCSSSNVYAKHFYSSSTNEVILSGYLYTNGIITIQGQYLYYTDCSGYILAAQISSINVFDWATTNYATTNTRYNSFINYYTTLSSWKTGGFVYSLALDDLDGDSALEIFGGVAGDFVFVWDRDGTVVPGWPQTTSGDVSSLAVADVDDDTSLEIIIGTYSGVVTIWNRDGTVVPGWPKTTNGSVSLAVADVDDDSSLEIIAGYDGGVVIWNSDGTVVPGWPKTSDDVCSLAVADVDDDSSLEIIAGYYDYQDDGGVDIWNSDGTVVPGWPQTTSGSVSSLAIADVDDDSELEIIVGTYSGVVTIWNSDGTVISGWPQTTSGNNFVRSLAVADVDDDSSLEIIAGYDGGVVIWNSDGTVVPGWPQTTSGSVSSLAVADVDDDSELEITAGCGSTVVIWNSDGTVVPGWPKRTSDSVSSLAVADVDDDSELEILAGDIDGVTIWNSIGLGYAPLYTDSVNNQRTGTYLDTDDDGLFDHEEDILGTDMSKVDTDSDGYNDFEEIVSNTDPLDSTSNPESKLYTQDTDGDGLSDGDEVNTYGTDPLAS